MNFTSNYGSSFWLGNDFDLSKREGSSKIDLTKLASARRAISNFVNIVTGEQIPVTFQGYDSYTDGKSVVIGTKIEDKNFDPAVGLALHEGSHIAYTDFDLIRQSDWESFVRMQGLDPLMEMTYEEFNEVKSLLNWIEDRRIDLLIYKKAPGYRVYYQAMYDKYFNSRVIDKALREGNKTSETMDDYMFHIINFTNINRQLDSLENLRKIWNIIDLKNIGRLKTTIDAGRLACDVYKVIKEGLPEEKEDSDQDDQCEEDQDDRSNCSGRGEGDNNDENDEEKTPTPDVNGMSERQKHLLDKAIRQQKEFLEGDAKKTGRLSKSQGKIVKALEESGTESREVEIDKCQYGGDMRSTRATVIKKINDQVICSLDDLFIYGSIDYINGTANEFRSERINDFHQRAIISGIILGKQLGRKLQVRNTDRTLKSTRLKTGKIDKRLLSQLGFGNTNVFHRIVTDKYKDYMIHISIDASGSMNGNRFVNALKSAVAVAQAASMTSGIRVQISLRGTSSIGGSRHSDNCITMYVYDSAHDKMSHIKRYFKFLTTFGCTPEGVAFKSIEQDIIKDAKGAECIFVNYSDGGPSRVADFNYDPEIYTKKVINGFREQGIHILSYFICEYESSWSKATFTTMYGEGAKFINPLNMTEVSKTLNEKFLEMEDVS